MVKLKLFINEASRQEESSISSKQQQSAPFYKKKHSSSRFNASRLSLKSKQSNHPSECLINNSTTYTDTISNSSSSSSSVSISSLSGESGSSLESLDLNNIKSKRKLKQPDSDEFNYWFECFSFSTGQINLDLALDKGDPLGQIKFLRLHDRKQKNLYFLWLPSEDITNSSVYERIRIKSEKSLTYKCGCFGGCHFYSVFSEKYSNKRSKQTYTDEEFFNLNKSITRGNENYAQSYFFQDKKVLDSHSVMINKYEPRMYTFKLNATANTADDNNQTPISSNSLSSIASNRRSSHLSINSSKSNKQQRVNSRSTLTSVKNGHKKSLSNIDKPPQQQQQPPDLLNGLILQNELRKSASVSTLSNSSSGTIRLNNDDDYYTADEEEEEILDEIGNKIRIKKYEKNPNKKRAMPGGGGRISQKSVSSLKSKNSFVSVRENDNMRSINNSKLSLLLGNNNRNSSVPPELPPFPPTFSKSTSELRPTRLHLENNFNDQTLKPNSNNNNYEVDTNDQSSQIETEMTLKFDIQRPILDSVLPKYFYLKYLSRAYVQNWNKSLQYPYYEDHKTKNINFEYRQKGFDTSYVSSTSRHVSNTNIKSNIEDYFTPEEEQQQQEQQNEQEKDQLKCKINLKFTHNLECYITPLSLTSLERFIKSIKSYKASASHLITQLQSKSESNFVDSNSIKEVISKTQVSVHIPQIMVCSLQCGLSEGDKVSNAFSNTLACPEEFMTLSLFTICVHSVQTQLIDSQNKTAAIFMIDKIETQFCRLFENKSLAQPPIKLSCISDKHSKTSIRCFKENDLLGDDDKFKKIQNSIMYECAFERISIKAVKKLNANTEVNNAATAPAAASSSSSQPSPPLVTDSDEPSQHNRLSLSEFEISKIWFSFPEPPISPKGKRKIPYTRNDWNLLSSVSPGKSLILCQN